MTNATPSPPRKRSSWLRKLFYVAGGLLVLLVVAYFVFTSSAFFKGVILPRIGKAVGGKVTVASASISPFSRVELRQVKVVTTGAEPLLEAEDVRLRYSLLAILRGTLKVDEITLTSPVVQITQQPDGACNLDPLLKPGTNAPGKPASGPASSRARQIDLKNFALKNATVRYVKNLVGGGRETAELTDINITLDRFQNGQSGKLTTAAAFKMSRPTNDLLEAKSAGEIDFTLGPDLMPTALKARVEQVVLKAEGSLSQLAGCRHVLAAELTPNEVKDLTQSIYRGDQLLGEFKVSGPLDLSKKEGRLKLEVSPIDRQVLNLFGAPMGIDFGSTKLNSVTEVELTHGGSVIGVNTRFNAASFSVTQKGQTTPPLDLAAACSLTANTESKSLTVQTLTLDGKEHQRQFLRGNLAQPMSIAWGNAAAPAGNAVFDLAVTNFNLAEWKSFFGGAVSDGDFSLNANVSSQQSGKQLKLAVTSQITGLAAKLGTNSLTRAAMTLKLNAQVADMKKFSLTDYRLELTQQAQPALNVSGSASYDGAAFSLQSRIEAVAARLLGSGPATPVSVDAKVDGSFAKQIFDLHQLQLSFTPTQRAAKNELTATGQFDLSAPGLARGRLSVKGGTLDLTPLYDVFAGQPSTSSAPATKSAQPGQPASASPGNNEPEPMSLPVQFTADVNLAQVWLREISIQNCQLTAKVDGGKINLDPCQLALNGGPVKATVALNLGVKGYTYALTLLMDKVPLGPIANTFSPANAGKYQGLILANAQINGAGITGKSLQKNLGGQATFSFTNADIKLTGPKMNALMVPIASLLGITDITASPLTWVDTRVDLGGGNINLSRCTVESEAFEGKVRGVIPIADVLTNSPLNLPVQFSLRRSLAQKSGLVPANAPANSTYVQLANFVTVKGTLGAPKTDLDKLALGGLLLNSGAGIAEKLGVNVGTNAGNLIQSIGGLLGGSKQSATNQSATNAAPKSNLLDIFKRN